MSTLPLADQFGQTLAKLQGKELETAFLSEIVAHHQAAVEMARLETERGVDADLRAYAQKMAAGHKRQMDQFTGWLHDWYGMTPQQAMQRLSPEPRKDMQELQKRTQQMLSRLRATGRGTPFDLAFAQMMLPHGAAALIQFLEPQARATHPELRTAAASGFAAQEQEITEFLTWLSAHVSGHATDGNSPQEIPPKGAAATGDGATHASVLPLVSGGGALTAAGAGAGVLLLRRRRGAGQH